MNIENLFAVRNFEEILEKESERDREIHSFRDNATVRESYGDIDFT